MTGRAVLRDAHVLLGVGGGIAAYKAAALTRALRREGATVQVVLTESAAAFVGPATFAGLTGREVPTGILADAHRILHVQLAREADVAIVAPATANLLAKFATGLADDLLSSTWTCLTCPTVIAPAMHTEMWQHPAVQANARLLADRGAEIVGPDEGELAGGDEGPGRMAEEPAILDALARALAPPTGPLVGRRVVVTAGGTREPIDPVRFIGNRSSGKMGTSIAEACARRGARVDLVTTASGLPVPPGVRALHVDTALEMREAVRGLTADADAIVKAAAVADFRPASYHDQKLKKEADGLAEVVLTRNPDILAELGRERGPEGPLLVGFAAETDLEEERGREKLHDKGIDLIVINRVDMADAGFGVDTNRALLLTAQGGRTEVPLTTKSRLAEVLCNELEHLLAERDRGTGPEPEPLGAPEDTHAPDAPPEG
ncbi:bifunctional phosphopantothenoylcysteine decarboxylase/phosphopantothenate--cysteine ligase CoaBC [Egibacter rhizosphaerae]|nr:bifunctional phosphopantothenoylcysteine decarboxylase/phosphopantothenate--cysteine ligase CoaBC [Egibacter rhizosphaerae]